MPVATPSKAKVFFRTHFRKKNRATQGSPPGMAVSRCPGVYWHSHGPRGFCSFGAVGWASIENWSQGRIQQGCTPDPPSERTSILYMQNCGALVRPGASPEPQQRVTGVTVWRTCAASARPRRNRISFLKHFKIYRGPPGRKNGKLREPSLMSRADITMRPCTVL